jgi:uncharacterized repeat protein (TIGR04138 family)
MRNENFERALNQLLKQDNRYPRAAYAMMPVVLDYTVRRVQESRRAGKLEDNQSSPHVSGQQLAEGFRDYLLEEFGPFAYEIAADLNIVSTLDIGHLVYNLISVGCFGKTDEDRLEDFDNVFDLKEALCAPFEIKNPEFKRLGNEDENGLA